MDRDGKLNHQFFSRARWQSTLRGFRSSYQCALLLVTAVFLLALNPEELGEPWAEIARLMNARDYDTAIGKLQEYMQSSSEPEHLAEIYYRIGDIYNEYIHNYDKALDAYQKVVNLGKKVKSLQELEPYLPLSRMKIAGILRRAGRYDDAVEVYRKVAADYPGPGYAEFAMRNIKGMQDAQMEIRLQREIIDGYPGTEFAAEAQFDIAELYLSVQTLDNPQQAIEEYTRLVDQYPNSRLAAEAQLRIGNVYRALLNRPEEAISAYQKLVQGQFAATRFGAEALIRIGRLYYSELRNYGEALNVFNKLVRDYPAYWKFPAAVYWQGTCYEQLKDYDNAIGSFGMFVQLYPDSEPAWLADIGKLGERRVKEEIESKIEDLRKSAPETKWREAGRLYSIKEYRAALAIYRELMSRYPGSELSGKARIKIQEDRLENLAEIQIQQDIVKKKGAGASAAQYRIAEIYELEMRDSRAVKEYKKVVTEYPDTYWATEALYRMGLVYSGSNSPDFHSPKGNTGTQKIVKPDYPKAIATYDQLIREYPKTYVAAKAYYQEGEIYRTHLRKYRQALEAYTKVVEDYPERSLYVGEGYKDSLADEAQFRIGRIYYENLKNYDMALKTFGKFLEDYPDSCRRAAAYSFIAAIQEKQRDNKAAVNSFERIIDIIVDSDVQNSFFIRDALREGEIIESGLSRFELQRDIIRQIRQKISKLQGQG